MRYFNPIKFIFIFMLAAILTNIVAGKCHNMLEKKGKCTKCPSSKFLYKGDCFNKIRGCQDYLSDKICLSCQSGYVFNQGMCIKEAVFYRIQKLDIPSVKINIEGELTFKDIEERIGQSRKIMFELINRHFKDKYAQNISSCTISSVKYIETINGVIFTIYYRSTMRIFEAVAFIDSKRDSKKQKTLTELDFAQKNSIPAYSLEEINQGLKKKYVDILKDCLLSSIQKVQSDKYKMSFVNSKGLKYQCIVRKQPFEQIQEIKKVQNPIDMEDILAYIFSVYPELKPLDFQVLSAPFFQSNQNQGLYVLLFEQKYQIKITYSGGTFQLESYKNLQIEKQQAQNRQGQQIDEQHTPIQKVGAFAPFQDLTDPLFLQVWRHFISQYPKYQKFEIDSVRYQIVSGTNFQIKIKSPQDIVPEINVKTLIYYPLISPIQIIELQIEDQVVNLDEKSYSQEKDKEQALQKIKENNSDAAQCFEYQKDNDFKQAYGFLISNAKILNSIPIVQVKKLECQDHIDYDIVYSDKQKAKVRQYKEKKQKNLKKNNDKFDLIYYQVDGTDITSGRVTAQSTRKKVIGFIESEKSQIFKNNLIQSYKEQNQGYNVNLLTSTGSYQVFVESGLLNYRMLSLVNTSPDNCYEFTQDKIHNESEIVNVDTFLKSNYGLNGAVFQLAQAEVTDKMKRFRVLYTDNFNRKLDVLLENFSDKYIVVQSLILQEGYIELPFADNRIAPIQALAKVRFHQFIQNCQVKLRLFNQTHYKLIYSCHKKAFQFIYSVQKKADRLQLIYKGLQNKNQTDANRSKLVDLNQIIKDVRFNEVEALVRSKFSEYIKNSQITQVQRQILAGVQGKTFSFYKIYYRSSLGYYVCESIWSDAQIKVTNFYLATVQTNKNCQLFNESSKECIKCLSGYELEFSSCYKKIQHCSVQTGNICVKCDTKAVLSSGKCIRSCQGIFKLRSSQKKQQK